MKKVKIKNQSSDRIAIDLETTPRSSTRITIPRHRSMSASGSDWKFTEHSYQPPKLLTTREAWYRVVNDPSLVLSPDISKGIEDLLYYFEEKGLSVVDVQVRGGVCSVGLEDLKPKYFNKVVLPELRRYVEKAQRRVTYRFKTFRKMPIRRVSVHLEFWFKDERPEVVRFPVS